MADWKFEKIYMLPDKGISITRCMPTLGDAFSPPIPVERLRTLNWTTSGEVHLYSAAMDFIATHGRGSRMRVDNPAHLALGKAVLVAASNDVEYYCLTPINGGFFDGEVYEILPGGELPLSGMMGKSLFIADGSLTLPGAFDKHHLLSVETLDSMTLTAGVDGAVVVVFYLAP